MTQNPGPWPPGAATGLGSLPGTDPDEAVRLVFGELPDLPFLPELPERGPGAELIGRSAALLVDLPVEIAPTGWRLTARPGRELRRARDLLARDLDALSTQAGDYVGALKLQAAGIWTMAAGLELPSGHRVLSDAGAVRDLGQSLAAGLAQHLGDIAARVPGAIPIVQLDEPSLPAVLAGRIPTPSGYGTIAAVPDADALRALAELIEHLPAAATVIHCCAPDAPLRLMHQVGAAALAVDAALLSTADLDPLGEALDSGAAVWLGVLPGTDAEISFDAARATIFRIWGALGFPRDEAAANVVPTPACGLAGASEEYVRRAFGVLRDVGRALLDP